MGALRQIEELRMKQAQGLPLEKTQEGKIEREGDLRAELEALLAGDDAVAPAEERVIA